MSGGSKKKSGFQITSVTSDYAQREEGPPGGGEVAEEAAAARNGPAVPPDSPGTAPAAVAAAGPGGGGGSRFRVVKLDQGAGEPYRRGRWTCRDCYEQEAADAGRAGRLADAARLPQSLDSRLEAAGLRAKPPGPFSPRAPRRGPAPQAQLALPPGPGAAGHQARSLGGGLPLLLLRPQRTPPSPGAQARPPPPPGDSGERTPPGAAPTLLVEERLLPRNLAQLIPRETEEPSKVHPRESRSRPTSPGPPFFRDASPSRRTSDPFGAARFSLARSMFGMGVVHDTDDDSGTNSSMIAIDNKIEQAMDLVKSHLMFAVREEVEVLREQIKELSERNALLEQENALLRSLASVEQLTCFQAQVQAAKPSPSGTA